MLLPYIDTTVVAGYVENPNNGNRFEKVSTSTEHVRLSYHACTSSFGDNSELDVGYNLYNIYRY